MAISHPPAGRLPLEAEDESNELAYDWIQTSSSQTDPANEGQITLVSGGKHTFMETFLLDYHGNTTTYPPRPPSSPYPRTNRPHRQDVVRRRRHRTSPDRRDSLSAWSAAKYADFLSHSCFTEIQTKLARQSNDGKRRSARVTHRTRTTQTQNSKL